jgi:uncharacterized protein YndB with AHSA1/START domain
MEDTDRIERRVVIRASRSRVWKALTDAREFGTWFRVELEGDFVVGRRIEGKMTYPGHEGAPFAATVVRMDRERCFAFRWPADIESVQESDQSDTLVEFLLEDAPEGTLLTVVESGFDRLPAARRLEAFRGNSEGWTIQVENVRRHVEG